MGTIPTKIAKIILYLKLKLYDNIILKENLKGDTNTKDLRATTLFPKDD